MRVLLVDDERLVLAMATRALQTKRPEWIVETASDGLEAMQVLRSKPVDILITDVQMPGMDGMALLMQVRRDPELARLPLVLISAQDDRSSVRQGMFSGADDYLTKPFTVDELILTVESRLRRLERGPEPGPQSDDLKKQLLQALTEREVEVLALIGQGLVTKEIAAELGLSPKTVSAHRQNIMEKLDLHNAAALAALAIRANVA
ncbi:MAG: response regulator transcription factor [Holophagaceae bacterium]|nr:response regulator transcription factor [Holophagaceae bacterium]